MYCSDGIHIRLYFTTAHKKTAAYSTSHYCASEYLKELGRPSCPADLIGFSETDRLVGVLAEEGAERVLPDLPPLTGEIWLVAHRELKINRRVRTVFDFLDFELTQHFVK